jgi:anti-sigma factor RsiW
MTNDDLTCEELVELVTEYLEGGLSAAERDRFDAHLGGCDGCSNYLDQIRATVEIAGRVTVEDLRGEVKTELLAAFRDWKRT